MKKSQNVGTKNAFMPKNNFNYTHTWVQIISSVRVTYFLNHKYIDKFYSFKKKKFTWVYSFFLLIYL